MAFPRNEENFWTVRSHGFLVRSLSLVASHENWGTKSFFFLE